MRWAALGETIDSRHDDLETRRVELIDDGSFQATEVDSGLT
jgi:hypothetical protein